MMLKRTEQGPSPRSKFVRWIPFGICALLLLAVALLTFGLYAFHGVNVEAYPDPAPAIVEVIARFPGASPEEVERQVTIPLEVVLAGMPGLKYARTQSRSAENASGDGVVAEMFKT